MIVQKPSYGGSHIVVAWFGVYPFGVVVHNEDNILVPYGCRQRFRWTYQIKVPFLEWLER